MFEKLSSEFIKARNFIFFIRAFLKRVEKTNLNERCNKEEMFLHNPSQGRSQPYARTHVRTANFSEKKIKCVVLDLFYLNGITYIKYYTYNTILRK